VSGKLSHIAGPILSSSTMPALRLRSSVICISSRLRRRDLHRFILAWFDALDAKKRWKSLLMAASWLDVLPNA
jgi:hypothetical protein